MCCQNVCCVSVQKQSQHVFDSIHTHIQIHFVTSRHTLCMPTFCYIHPSHSPVKPLMDGFDLSIHHLLPNSLCWQLPSEKRGDRGRAVLVLLLPSQQLNPSSVLPDRNSFRTFWEVIFSLSLICSLSQFQFQSTLSA